MCHVNRLEEDDYKVLDQIITIWAMSEIEKMTCGRNFRRCEVTNVKMKNGRCNVGPSE